MAPPFRQEKAGTSQVRTSHDKAGSSQDRTSHHKAGSSQVRTSHHKAGTSQDRTRAGKSASQPYKNWWTKEGTDGYKKALKSGERSRFNGYKLMTQQMEDVISKTERLFPSNVFREKGDVREHCVVFHDVDKYWLAPGEISVGNGFHAKCPADLKSPSARVMVHSHPYMEGQAHFQPSLTDHMLARKYPPTLEHIVQAPKFKGNDSYIYYSGAYPPRFYYLLKNPYRHPNPPPSPDGSLPPFRFPPYYEP